MFNNTTNDSSTDTSSDPVMPLLVQVKRKQTSGV